MAASNLSGPLPRYQKLIEQGTLEPDSAQAEAMAALQHLYTQLASYDPTKRSLFGKKPQRPMGLYMWGGVGRGKSLLMDLFFNNLPRDRKMRVHFHAFMVETHERIAAWRAMSSQERRAQGYYVKPNRGETDDDPIPHVARAIFERAEILCFDEVQISDITDAMLLGRLFERLFHEGCILIATSNRHPNDLYKDGLNRELFLPSIDLIKKEMIVHELIASRDYRLDQLTGSPVYYTPLTPEIDQSMDTAWERLICGGTAVPEKLVIKGRTLVIPRTARGAARASFDQLCTTALGAEDYLRIADTYHTIFLDHIPLLTPDYRNEAKRFVTLIDALYENSVKLVCSAAAIPSKLYPTGHGSFEFERTVSRLIEMQSKAYLTRPVREETPPSLSSS